MDIRFNPKKNDEAVRAAILSQKERIRQAVLLVLERVGEQFVRDARLIDTYEDDTGNLRSSKGFVILYNGKQLMGFFPGDKEEGKSIAKTLVEEIKGNFTEGLVLIVVAGMGYAAAVEAKGFDVLTGSSDKAVKLLKELFAKVGRKSKKMS